MNIYFTDEITRIAVTIDNYDVITESESDPIACRIKDNNKLIIDNQGQEVVGELLILYNKSYTFNYGDKVKIKKRWGNPYKQPDKKFIIKKIGERGGFQKEYGALFL